MKKLVLFTLFVMSLSSCITMKMATGEVLEQTMTIDGDINALSISSGFDVIVDRSIPHGEAHITTHSDMFDKLDIRVEGTTLNISLNSHELQAKTLEVRISEYPYNTIAVSGGADFEWHSCTVPSLSVAASGGSDVEITANSQEISIATSGGADVEMDGSCKHLAITASGGSDVDASKLLAEDVEVTTSGGADVDVYATNSLKARASGGSDVRYGGNPKTKDIDSSGGADIKPAK